jgi:hypothetical protein
MIIYLNDTIDSKVKSLLVTDVNCQIAVWLVSAKITRRASRDF